MHLICSLVGLLDKYTVRHTVTQSWHTSDSVNATYQVKCQKFGWEQVSGHRPRLPPGPGAFGLRECDTIIKLSLFNELTNSRLLARRGL